ncbi:MAG: hypothetical protein AB7G37_17295 [Solirubrobacteraceae bacterium]
MTHHHPRRARLARLFAVVGVATAALAPSASAAEWTTLENPIDPRQQTALEFGHRSHWLQPWRGYLDTQPSSRLRDAIGINFNVSGDRAPATAKLLGDHGFTRGRIEVGWDQMSYADPTALADRQALVERLQAMKDGGLRPLILLNANEGNPGPSLRGHVRITAAVAPGSRTAYVHGDDVGKIVVGRTGFDFAGVAGLFIVTARDGNTVTLSRAVPAWVPAGQLGITTLRYAPFAPPKTNAGAPNPSFEDTLGGWLAYSHEVTSVAREVLGPDGFDVEIWNELNAGSAFLYPNVYYDPVPPELQGTGSTTEAILARTVKALRDAPGAGEGMGIGDGFANQSPYSSPATSPAGLTALDKHPYQPKTIYRFPGDLPSDNPSVSSLDAQGNPNGGRHLNGIWWETFTPTYNAMLPEYYLTATQTEHLIRDMSPITTKVGEVSHGRNVTTPSGDRLQTWITETGMDPTGTDLTGAARRAMQAKAALRSLVAYANKGAHLVTLYTAAEHQPWDLIPPSFFDDPDAENPDAGPALEAVRRLVERIPRRETASRKLELRSVADQHGGIQFEGDGTEARPTLYDRDVVAFLPFQTGDREFQIPTYVMTRDVSHAYKPELATDDPARYDKPDAPFRLKIGGVDGAGATASAYDPLRDEDVSVSIVDRGRDEITVELPLDDAPRLLKVVADEPPPAPDPEPEPKPDPAPAPDPVASTAALIWGTLAWLAMLLGWV